MNTRAGQGTTGPFTDRTTHDRTAGERRRALRWRRLALAATVAAVAAWLVTGARSDAGRISREFAFTGARAQYVVPLGVCRIRVEAAGGSGGLQGAAGTPGLGARVTATLRVSPDETLLVHVGGQGGTAVGATPGRGGWNGGGNGGAAFGPTDGHRGRAGSGGGGATDVRRGEGRLEDRVLVAGGGGGGGGGGIGGPYGTGGGEGGSPTGHDGFAPLGSANPVTGGRGGTPSAGGAPGVNSLDSTVTATGGSLGAGGFGASGGVNGGGGGGGGLYGGGGGGTEFQWTTTPLGAAHGGGGSSFGPSTTRFRNGVWANLGSGSLTISYDLAADSCAEQDIAPGSQAPAANADSPPLGALPPGSGRPEAVAFDRHSPQIGYVMTQGDMTHGHVFKTTDGGSHWQATAASGSGWGGANEALTADPRFRPRILRSTDSGHTWTTAP